MYLVSMWKYKCKCYFFRERESASVNILQDCFTYKLWPKKISIYISIQLYPHESWLLKRSLWFFRFLDIILQILYVLDSWVMRREREREIPMFPGPSCLNTHMDSYNLQWIIRIIFQLLYIEEPNLDIYVPFAHILI